MSLYKSAVQEISKMSAAVVATDYLSEIPNTIPSVIVPESYTIRSLEHLHEKPFSFKGTYNTNNIDEFIEYVSKHGDYVNSHVFIDADSMTANAIIDHGTPSEPQWGRHKALLKLIAEPEYKTLLDKADQLFKQLDFIDFAEEYKDYIRFIDADSQFIDHKEAIKTLRTLKAESTNSQTQSTANFSESKSALESLEIKAADRELPWGFQFLCVPFEALHPVTFTAQLRAVKAGNEITLKYRLYQANEIRKSITENFKTLLTTSLVDCVNVFIGKFSSPN